MVPATFGAGIVAGLGATVPIGAMGVMLLREGTERGWRHGTPAAMGVGFADFVFCVVALAAGSFVAPLITTWGKWPAAVGGVLLLIVAALTLRRAYQSRPPAPRPDGPRAAAAGIGRAAMFFGLTIMNPMPLLYFLAISVGLGGSLHQRPVAGAFTIGVGIASFCWCVVLVGIGAALRARSTDRMQKTLSVIGGLIVAVCGVILILAAVL